MTRVVVLGLIVVLLSAAAATAQPRAAVAQDGLTQVLRLPGIASDGPPGPQADALDASLQSWAGNAIRTYSFEVVQRSGGLRIAARVSVVDGVIAEFEPECRDIESTVDCPDLFPPEWTVDGLQERVRVALYQGQLADYRANVNGIPLAATIGNVEIEVTAFTTHHDATDLALARGRWALAGVDGYSTTVRFWDPERSLFVLRTAVVEDGVFTTVSAQCAAPDAVPAPCAAPGPATPAELFEGVQGLFDTFGEGAVEVTYDLYDGRPVQAQWGPVLDPGGRAEFRVLFFDLLESNEALALLRGH